MHLVYTRLKVQDMYTSKIGGLATAVDCSYTSTDRFPHESRRYGLSRNTGETLLSGALRTQIRTPAFSSSWILLGKGIDSNDYESSCHWVFRLAGTISRRLHINSSKHICLQKVIRHLLPQRFSSLASGTIALTPCDTLPLRELCGTHQ